MKNNYNVLSLFSSSGIGELGIKASGLSILVSNELLQNRCELYRENFPEVTNICGDIWEKQAEIIKKWKEHTKDAPFLIYATPPCQGMSSNGAGKLLREIREGRRSKEDPRNRLIIPTMAIVRELHPRWLILENVPTMDQTIIRDENNDAINIIDYVKRALGEEYVGRAEVVNCADFGIAQMRKRLFTIFTRDEKGKEYFKHNKSFIPRSTHCENGDIERERWVTLRDVIGNLPPLSSENGKNENLEYNPYHQVPIMDKEKMFWVSNTPEGNTAFNNQCCVETCKYQKNPTHGSNYEDGIHQSNKGTPIYCQKCGALLPRPTVVDKKTGERRLISGFDTAYRRMEWDKPAPTLTQKLHAIASDKKIHPSQNRPLSLYEAMLIQTITDYEYSFSVNNKRISRNAICQIIGESVPPKIIQIICENILSI